MNQISVNNLGKQYLISRKTNSVGSYIALRDVLVESFSGFGKMVLNSKTKENARREKFWALKDVSFNLKSGERLGIIGKNGSGKTTLLKLLNRITEPSTGIIKLNGRTASLLEIGTGFHPELTGRENIYLNGAILGMKKADITRKFETIVEFSEVEKFLDTPVKRYSSGMYLRLAFSVAANLDSEIMLVDEVLAVGDASFQKKCLGRMEDNTQDGKTILFVSHNMNAIKQLCDKVIWIDKGMIKEMGNPEYVINKYLQSSSGFELEKVWNNGEGPGNEKVRFRSIRVIPQDSEVLTIDSPLKLEFEFENKQTDSEINLSFILWTLAGECVFNTASEVKMIGEGVYKGTCLIPANLLNSNAYSVEIMVIKDRSYAIYKKKDIINFEVNDGDRVEGWYGNWVGAVRPKLDFTLEQKNVD